MYIAVRWSWATGQEEKAEEKKQTEKTAENQHPLPERRSKKFAKNIKIIFST
jgi:hypothetical protein